MAHPKKACDNDVPYLFVLWLLQHLKPDVEDWFNFNPQNLITDDIIKISPRTRARQRKPRFHTSTASTNSLGNPNYHLHCILKTFVVLSSQYFIPMIGISSATRCYIVIPFLLFISCIFVFLLLLVALRFLHYLYMWVSPTPINDR